MRGSTNTLPPIGYPVTGTDVSVQSGDYIKASNLEFAFSKIDDFNLSALDTPVNKTVISRIANNPGTLKSFAAMVHVPGSSASVTVDLKKNGVSVLASPITITNATTADTLVAGSISTPSFTTGDVFTVVLTVSSSTGMTGVASRTNGVESGQPL
jgi:hypothetical protein